jgi:hypothetical protein
MLGRLRMSLDDCIEAYLKLSQTIFQPRRSAVNYAGKAQDFLQANGTFDHGALEKAIKEVIRSRVANAEDTLLKDPDPVCKACVSTAQLNLNL